MNMMQPYLDRQHHVYFDRLFARSKLTDDLAQRGTYSCCTVMLNRRGLPAGARKMKVEQRGEVQFQQKGNVLLTAWKDKHHVSVLSINSNAEMIAVGNLMKQKPSTIQHYNAHMGGVDLADQFRSYYNVPPARRGYYQLNFRSDIAELLRAGYTSHKHLKDRQSSALVAAVDVANVGGHHPVRIQAKRDRAVCRQCSRGGKNPCRIPG